MYTFATMMQYIKQKFIVIKGGFWDYSGIITSVVCVFHCLLLPLVISTAPLFGIELIKNTWLEVMTLIMSFFFGYLAIGRNFKKKKNKWPMLFFTTGFLLLLVNILFDCEEWMFITPAAFFIITAHALNFKNHKA